MPTKTTNDHSAIANQWRFICQTRGGISYLHFLQLLSCDTGSTVLEKLRTEYYHIKAQAPYKTWGNIAFLWQPVLEVVTISEVSIPL